jgi:hypothetical protein
LAAWTGVVKTGGRLNVFKAMQNPTICTFTTTVDGLRVRAKAQDIWIPVSTARNCDYMARSNASWLTVNGDGTYSGNSSISIHVAANTTGVARTATLTFGGRTFVIRQTAETRG